MEQLRTVLAWMSKHHFWLLSGLAVLLSFAVWYVAANDLSDRKKKNLDTIKAAFSKQGQLSSTQPKPSPSVKEQQQSQIDALAKETEAIWQELYDRQRKDVLKWPQQLPPAFLREIEDKKFGDDINQIRSEQYADYIRRRFADLPKLINANEVADDATGGGRGYGGGGEFGGGGGGFRGFGGQGGEADSALQLDENGNPIEPDYTVFWAEEDQQRIKSDLDWPQRQSHWRIWVTQEDLWVYETMLRAIDATNKAKGSTRFNNAAINYVQNLQVGRDAAKESRTPGRILRMEGAASSMGEGEFGGEAAMRGGGMEGEFGGEGMDYSDRGDGSGSGQLTAAEEKARWLSGRYIDDQGLPIQVPPDEEPLAPATFGQEIKRLPVRLVVQMDERWLATLISELANADLQIKVTEVRVSPQSADGGGGEYGGSRGGGSRGGFGGGGEFGGGFGGGSNNTDVQVFDRKPYMKPVVIQGVVLIFNPPNEEILKGQEGDAPADTFTMN